MISRYLAFGSLLWACALTAASATATVAPPSVDAIEEVQISGERPGPGLWKVSRPGHTLYILGTLTPLPKKVTWRSREVENVLARAQLLIPERASVSVKAGPIMAIRLYAEWRHARENAGDAKLAQVLPPDLYRRFRALRDKYAPHNSGMEERRPLLAAQTLYSKAVDAVGLTSKNTVGESVVKLAKKLRVPVADIEQRVEDPRAVLADFSKISARAEQECLSATVARLETDLGAMRDRATAWSIGDVGALRTQPGIDQENACWGALVTAPRIAQMRAESEALWFNAVVKSLQNNVTSIAVAPISRLFERDGVLAKLQAKGYTVTAP